MLFTDKPTYRMLHEKKRWVLNDTCSNMFSHKNIRIDDQLIECSMDNKKGFEIQEDVLDAMIVWDQMLVIFVL